MRVVREAWRRMAVFLIERKPRTESATLCSECQDFDDYELLFSAHARKLSRLAPNLFDGIMTVADNLYKFLFKFLRRGGLKFRPLTYYYRNTSCLVCSAIGRILRHHVGEDADARVALGCGFLAHYNPGPSKESVSTQERDHTPQFQCVLPICIWTDRRGQSPRLQMSLAIEMELTYESPPGRSLQAVTEWERKGLDVEAIKTWLANCKENCGSHCNNPSTLELPPFFRLVDTERWCVVQVERPVVFLALSYVWSTASSKTGAAQEELLQLTTKTQSQLEQTDSLRTTSIPELLEDAVQLCSDLGHRYIWIDQLCVIQDDHALKMTQINAMDAIYSNAELTIVGLAEGPTIGLPGASTRPRPKTLSNDTTWILRIGKDNKSFATCPTIHDAVSGSLWNTRGWTYQERVMSKRHLFVGERHFYLNCFSTTLASNVPNGFGNVSKGYERGIHSYRGDAFQKYIRMVENYTPRNLSRDSDTLNAFQGVGNIFLAEYQTNLIQGLPESDFLQALLWRHQAIWRPRQLPEDARVPSWSWAAFEGPVTYKPTLWTFKGLTYSVEPSSSPHLDEIVNFYYMDPLDCLRQVRKRGAGGAGQGSHGSWPMGPAQQDLAIAKYTKTTTIAPGSLVFHTSAARVSLHESQKNLDRKIRELRNGFSLTHNLDEMDDFFDRHGSILADSTDTATELLSFLIVDKQGTPIGETFGLEVAGARKLFTPAVDYEVAVLGACCSNRKLVKQDYEENWGLVVMITQVHDGVSTRLGLGAVNAKAWLGAEPSWKTIVLS